MGCGCKRCSAYLHLLFIISQVLCFLGGGNAPIFGLSLLIDKINGENANSGLCAIGVLQILVITIWLDDAKCFGLDLYLT